jgi:putative tricarboxylic transport membrane protein
VASNPKSVGIGTGVGWFIGIVPGVGASLASILGYLVVKQVSRDQSQYGKGDVRGLIGAETANNASVGGALIPALALGIPGSVNTAVLLGVMMINGVQPGTNIFTQNASLLWVILTGTILGTIFATAVMIIGGWRLVRVIAQIPPRAVVPMIAMIACVALLLARGNPSDLAIALVMAVIGIILKKFRYSRVAFIIALLLGPLVEQSYLQALSISRGSFTVFFNSALSLSLWAIIAICIALHVHNVVKARRSANRNLIEEGAE